MGLFEVYTPYTNTYLGVFFLMCALIYLGTGISFETIEMVNPRLKCSTLCTLQTTSRRDIELSEMH